MHTMRTSQGTFVHRNGKLYRYSEESFDAVQKAFFFDRVLEKDQDYFPGGRPAQEQAHDDARKLLAREEEVLLAHLVHNSAPAAGSEALEGWSKFPVVRPLEQPVLVVLQGEVLVGTGCTCPRTGGAILLDGELIDSNQTIWWKYA